MAKKTDQTEEKIQQVEQLLGRTEYFIEKHKNLLITIVAGIAVVILGIVAVNKFYLTPRGLKAQSEMFAAQRYFENDSLKQALNGDGVNAGFLEIIDNYGSTKAGKLAHYYVGSIYMKQGKFQDAITHLKKFTGSDQIVSSMALGLIGDASMELGNKQEAVDYYLKAATHNTNNMTAPMYLMRAAWVYEDLNQLDKALGLYEKIQKEYYRSNEARDVEKYIARINTMQGK